MPKQSPSTMGEPVLALLANRVAKDHKATVEFDDPRLEYRRLFSEVWGTFLGWSRAKSLMFSVTAQQPSRAAHASTSS